MTQEREVMNIHEASEFLGISPDSTYKYLLLQGKLRGFRVGNRWRLRKSVLIKWMERCEQEVADSVMRGRASGSSGKS